MRAKASNRRAVAATVVRPSWLLVFSLTLAFAAGLRVPEPVQYLPFAASLVLFGLPHGALDHLVPARLAGRAADAGSVLGVVLLYAVLSSACLALWSVAPAAAFAAFVCVTAYHWGTGDLHALTSFGPAALDRMGRFTRAAFVAGRGCIPMLVPLAFFPDDYRGVAEDVTGLFGTGAAALNHLFEPGARDALPAAVVAVAAVSLLLAACDLGPDRRALLPVAGETILLFAFFAVVPPVLAVGLYFTLWHAPRHVARLVLLDEASGAGGGSRALRRFAQDAAPLTAVALLLLAGLYVAVPARAGDAGSLLAVYLVLVSMLTLPHAAVVAYMDARQEVWGRP